MIRNPELNKSNDLTLDSMSQHSPRSNHNTTSPHGSPHGTADQSIFGRSQSNKKATESPRSQDGKHKKIAIGKEESHPFLNESTRVVLEQTLGGLEQVNTRNNKKKHYTTNNHTVLRAKNVQYRELNDAVDLLLDGPTAD